MTEKEYYDDTEYISQSQLKDFLHCAYLYSAKYITKEYQEPEEENKAFIIGRAVDTLLTQPNLYNDMFFSADLRKISQEELDTKHAGKTHLTASDEGMAVSCVRELANQPLYKDMVSEEGWTSQEIIMTEIDGVKVKGKLDLLNRRDLKFIDVKTTRDITTFKPEMYAFQMAYYRMLLKDPTYTVMLAVTDKHAGYKRSSLYVFDNAVLDATEVDIRMALGLYKQTKELGFYLPVTDNFPEGMSSDEQANYSEEMRTTKCFNCPFYEQCQYRNQKAIKIIQ